MGRESQRVFYRPELDSLRFFAFFSVFMHHYLPKGGAFYQKHAHLGVTGSGWADSVAQAGSLGVDLFFVLSSYLITSLLLRERDTLGCVHVKAFYLRRALRIWPLYFVFLGVVLVVTRMDGSLVLSPHHIFAFAFFVGNWLPDVASLAIIVVPLWSVCLEEQFYLVWPWVARRASNTSIIRLCVGLLILSVGARVVLASSEMYADRIWNISLTRLDPIALGAILAIALQDKELRITAPVRVLLAAVAVVFLVASVHISGMMREHPTALGSGIGFLVSALACVTLFISAYGAEGPGQVLRSSWLTYLGRISYGLYVWHQLALYIGRKLLPSWHESGTAFGMYFALALGMTFAFAIISYHLLEMPFLKLKKRFTYIPSGALSKAAAEPRPAPEPRLEKEPSGTS